MTSHLETKTMRGQLLQQIIVYTEVRPLQRPRINMANRKIYQPLEDQLPLINLMKPYFVHTHDVPVIVDIHMTFTGEPIKFAISHAIGDIDNLAKSVNDALVKNQILSDDRNIVGQEVTKRHDSEASVLIKIYEADHHKDTTHLEPQI